MVGHEFATLPCVSCEGVHGFSTNAVNRDHPRGQLLALPSYRHSKAPIRFSTGGLIFCERSCTSDKVEFRVWMEVRTETRLTECDGDGMLGGRI